MRLNDLFLFFKAVNAPTDHNVVTKVTYKRPPRKLIAHYSVKGQYAKAVQRMYARRIRKGTLHANGTVVQVG